MLKTAGASLGKWARTINANDADPALDVVQDGSGVGIQCKGDILPSDDNTYDLGSAAKSFAEVHAQTAVYATSVVGNWSPSADGTYTLGTSGPLGWLTAYFSSSGGGDGDIDIIVLNVTGSPKLWWDESQNTWNSYRSNKMYRR